MGERPAGITVVSILVAIQAVLAILGGLEAMGIMSLGLGVAADSESAGLADVVIGIITLLVSYGLFATQGWAWLIAVIVTVVRILTALLAVLLSGIGSPIGIGSLVAIAIGLVLIWYLTRRDVRGAFGRA